ncbi:hypothetical protein D3C76_221760 [compost metagenome]
MDRVFGIHGFDQAKIDTPVGIIRIHVDFLADNAFFLLHILIGEIRPLYEIHKRTQIGLDIFRCRKQIYRLVKTGERIG